MVRRRAPSALRMPISRVRSVTVTIMMLVMPMPPTSRLMPATAPSSTVNVLAVSVRVDSSSAWLRIRNGSLAVFVTLSWVFRIAVTSFWACVDAVGAGGLHDDLAQRAVPGQRRPHRADRGDRDIVRILEAGGALVGEHADHGEQGAADGDLLADRVDRREQVGGDGLTDQHHLAVRGRRRRW